MQLKVWILLAALLAIAYAAIEPLELDLEAEESQDPSAEHVRSKRFLITKAILAKKALIVGGAVGLAGGLIKGKLLSGALGGGGLGGLSGGGGHGGWSSGGGGGWQKPNYAPSHGWSSGGGDNGWSGANANAWAGSNSW